MHLDFLLFKLIYWWLQILINAKEYVYKPKFTQDSISEFVNGYFSFFDPFNRGS